MESKIRNDYKKLIDKIVNIECFSQVRNECEKIYNELNSEGDFGEKQFYISVIGAMKSGKSAFINALLGEEILPSETEACTLVPTYININENNGKVTKTFIDETVEAVKGDFLEDLRKYRKLINFGEIDSVKKIKSYSLNHKLYFSKLNEKSNIILVDTPGINEQQYISDIKEDMYNNFDDIVKKSSVLIYIFDLQYFKSEENAELLERIKNNNADEKEIIFIINKIDNLSTNKGNTISDIENDVNKLLKEYGFEKCTIFPVSVKLLQDFRNNIVSNDFILESASDSINIDGETYYKKDSNEETMEIILGKSGFYSIEKYLIQVLTNYDEILKSNLSKLINNRKENLENIKKEISQQLDKELNHYKDNLKNYELEIAQITKAINKIETTRIEIPNYSSEVTIEINEKTNELKKKYFTHDYRDALRKYNVVACGWLEFPDYFAYTRCALGETPNSIYAEYQKIANEYVEILESLRNENMRKNIDKINDYLNSKVYINLSNILHELFENGSWTEKIPPLSKFNYTISNLLSLTIPNISALEVETAYKRSCFKAKITKSAVSDFAENAEGACDKLVTHVIDEINKLLNSDVKKYISDYLNVELSNIKNSLHSKIEILEENKETTLKKIEEIDKVLVFA